MHGNAGVTQETYCACVDIAGVRGSIPRAPTIPSPDRTQNFSAPAALASRRAGRPLVLERTMRKLLLTALIGLSVAACQTPQQSAGTAGGIVAGAVVAGPVGAVVGGVAGAVVAAPGGPLDPGYCYVTTRRGTILYDRWGRPGVRRC